MTRFETIVPETREESRVTLRPEDTSRANLVSLYSALPENIPK
jgi:hypothetical protein